MNCPYCGEPMHFDGHQDLPRMEYDSYSCLNPNCSFNINNEEGKVNYTITVNHKRYEGEEYEERRKRYLK